jgi:serine/threonine protein kinase
MSPEQIGGDAVDFRTDIFSFGVLAHELLSGSKPFQNENLFLLLEQIVKEEAPPLAEIAPDVSPALIAIVERAMQKKPEDRFATARDLRDALVAVQQQLATANGGPPDALEIPLPDDEKGRLAALARLEILDTEPEQEFDDLTLLASQLCGTPVALISFVDRDREWLKSKVGISESSFPRLLAFCAHAITGRDVFVVPDVAADGRFSRNPLVTDERRVRFYAGAPLLTPEGFAVGALSVIDRVPRELSAREIEALRALSRQVMAQLELKRRRRADREQSGDKLILEVVGLSDQAPPVAPTSKPQ